MIILTIRTDKPEAEAGLYEGSIKLAYKQWPAHRQLAETIHKKIQQLLDEQGLVLSDIEGIVYFKGPGSFTGLRIGAAVAGGLALANSIPLAARNGGDWIADGEQALRAGVNEQPLPFYGANPHITKQKK